MAEPILLEIQQREQEIIESFSRGIGTTDSELTQRGFVPKSGFSVRDEH
jgi:hypothetical protein